MRRKELFIYLPMLAMLLLVAGACFMFTRQDNDAQPPLITIDSEVLEISVKDPESRLFDGVSAADEQDGDVTGLMVVEKVSDLTEDHTAMVTYTAFDKAGNVSKASRTIQYTDYTAPVFSLTSPLVFTIGTNVNVLGRITVTDILDGDISRNVKGALTGNSTGLNTVGTHYVEFRVTNSLGDTARITLPVDVLPSNTYKGSIQLTKNLVHLKKGAHFEAADYFESMELGSLTLIPEDGVELSVSDNVNTAVPGVYSATYTAAYDESQAFTRLIVVVE